MTDAVSVASTYTVLTGTTWDRGSRMGKWVATIACDGKAEEVTGKSHEGEQRMELLAAVEGIKKTPEGASVMVVTQSAYLLKGITKWIKAWQSNGWRNAKDTPVEHRDLWEILAKLAALRAVVWESMSG